MNGIATRLQFDEAIYFAKARLCVKDDDLRQGRVETVRTGKLNGPYGMEGGFAIVYKFRTRTGMLRALRVFKKPMPDDMANRYRLLSEYFRAHASDITVDFRYHNQGLKVKLEKDVQIFPILDMEWIEGVTLIEEVDKLCRGGKKDKLERLLNQWMDLVAKMQSIQLAHGDLAGANVMVRPDGSLVLVDYDGVYIPQFAGWTPVVAGQRDYQHPQFMERPFDEKMDAFSIAVIYTALAALCVQPQLWDKYSKRNTNGVVVNDNLLFKVEDFKDPHRSALFNELKRLNSPQVKAGLQYLIQSCQVPIKQLSFPTHLIDPEYKEKQALVRLQKAVQNNNDIEIIKAWLPILDTYGPAEKYRKRKDEAKFRLEKLEHFREALKTDDDERIVKAYDPVLDGYPLVSPADRKRLERSRKLVDALRRLREALESGDERQIAVHYDPVLDQKLSSEERQQIDLARRCITMIGQLRPALQSNDDEQIVKVYNRDLIRPWMALSDQDFRQIAIAQQRQSALDQFRKALKTEDDEQIIASYQSVLDDYRYVTKVERQRLDLALRRIKALNRFNNALYTEDDEKIRDAYDPILDNYNRLRPEQRQRLELARRRLETFERFRKALETDDDEQIVAAYDSVLDGYSKIEPFQRKRLNLANHRIAALKQLRQAIQSDDDFLILAADDPLLTNYSKITPNERKRVIIAYKRWEALKRLRDAMQSGDERKIVKAYITILHNYSKILPVERHKIELALRCVRMFDLIRKAIESDDDEQIVNAYDPGLLRPWMAFAPEDNARIALAQKRWTALNRFLQAISADDDAQIIASYDPALLDRYDRITAEQRKRLALARRRDDALQKLRMALNSKDERQIVAAYDQILDGYSRLSSDERQQVELAYRCINMPQRVRQALSQNDDERIAKEYEPDLDRPWLDFTAEERSRISLARLRVAALERFRHALRSQDERQIVAAYDPILDNCSAVTAEERAQLALAHRCLAMPTQVRTAIQTDDDEAIAKAFDPKLIRSFTEFTSAEEARISLAIRRRQLIEQIRRAIESGQVEQALDLEQSAPWPISDPLLEAVKRRFIETLDPTNLTVCLEENTLRAHWEWPTSKHVQVVALVWRPDRWPSMPEEPGSTCHYVFREMYDRQGGFEFRVSSAPEKVYVQIFSALRCYSQLAETSSWLYSRGTNPGSRQIAFRRIRIECRLSDRRGKVFDALHISAASKLPHLIVVRNQDHLPMSIRDGVVVSRIDDQPNQLRTRIRVPLNAENWPAGTVLRVFASNDGHEWYPVSAGLRVEIS